MKDHSDCKTCEHLSLEIERLRTAIRTHMHMRGDDRCYLDDHDLYQVLPEGDTRPAEDSAVTLANCLRFIECRQQGREYISPEREIEHLRKENMKLRGWNIEMARKTVQDRQWERLEADNTTLHHENRRLKDRLIAAEGLCVQLTTQIEHFLLSSTSTQ